MPSTRATSGAASWLPATTTGQGAPASARAQRSSTSWSPPSVPPTSRTTSGSAATSGPRSGGPGVAPPATTATTRPPLVSATRRPASALTSSSLPTTPMRRPPPAEEHARTSASRAAGSAAASPATHASSPSRTSVWTLLGDAVPGSVVLCCARPSTRPSAWSTKAALVHVDPTSTQTTRSRPTRCSAGRGGPQRLVEVLDEVLDRLEPDGEADEVGGNLERSAGDGGVGHPAGVLDERLDPAQRLRQRPEPGRAAHLDSRLLTAGQPERDDA